MNRLKIKRVPIPILMWLVLILWADSAIADNQYVKVGLGQNPPLTIRNEGSVPTGLAIDIIQDVAKIENWQLEFVEDGWENLLKKLEMGEIDILTGIAHSKNRAKQFDFTSEAIIGNWGIIYRHPSVKVNSILDLSGLRIAMGPKGAHAIALVKLLKDFGVTYSVVETKNYFDVFDRVEKGEVDVGVVSRLFGASLAKNRQIVATGVSFNPVRILFATPKGKGTDLLVAIDAYLVKGKKDQTSSYQAHLERWTQSPVRKETPVWVIWGSTGTAFGLSIALLSVGLLRRRVKVKTRELQKSEIKFKKMIEKSPLPMVITDQAQDISFLNDKFTELFGYTLEDVSTAEEWWFSAYPDLEYRKKVQNSWLTAIEKANSDGTDIEMQEWALTIKDGTQRECEFYMIPLQDLSLIIMNDISERKKTEQKIIASKAYLDNILNNIGDPVFVKDGQHRFTLVNDAFCSTLGLPKGEIIGTTLFEDLPPDEMEHFKKIDRQVLADGQENLCEELLTVKSGKTLTILTKKTRYVDKNGDKFLIGVIRDITDRKQMEDEHKKLMNQLHQAQKMEAIGTLAGGIAHDFNNILGAIIGYTEMARDDIPDESSVAKDLHKVLEASARAAGLVRQILSFSRQDETEYILLHPASIVTKAIALLRPTLPSTIEITQDIDTGTGLIFGDPTQIHQILINLCTNSFHAMEETGGRLDISLKEIALCREDITPEPHIDTGSFIQLSVGDSGAGMTQQVKDKIFDPYFTTKGVGKGTGMGLSIVHGITKSYGGFVTLSSEPGKGSVFHVFLPVVNKEMLSTKEAIKQIPVGKEKILFIDDEDVLADMGKNMLERLGYHVTVRSSSLEALETFQNQPDQFDVVITDQTMPGMTGVDLARRMLQIRPDIPIILCTGYSSIISEEKVKAMGIREFALKPFGKRDIAMLIRKVLNGNQA